jgi:hypothetical protein
MSQQRSPLFQLLGLAVLAVIAFETVRHMPDLMRYLKIERM